MNTVRQGICGPRSFTVSVESDVMLSEGSSCFPELFVILTRLTLSFVRLAMTSSTSETGAPFQVDIVLPRFLIGRPRALSDTVIIALISPNFVVDVTRARKLRAFCWVVDNPKSGGNGSELVAVRFSNLYSIQNNHVFRGPCRGA